LRLTWFVGARSRREFCGLVRLGRFRLLRATAQRLSSAGGGGAVQPNDSGVDGASLAPDWIALSQRLACVFVGQHCAGYNDKSNEAGRRLGRQKDFPSPAKAFHLNTFTNSHQAVAKEVAAILGRPTSAATERAGPSERTLLEAFRILVADCPMGATKVPVMHFRLGCASHHRSRTSHGRKNVVLKTGTAVDLFVYQTVLTQ
jgi:hypothetical protein